MKRKFSSFFKSLVIELDKDLYGPDNHLVEVRFTLFVNRLISVRASVVVRAFAHRAMGRRIDPSWGGPNELFFVPASAPRTGVTKAMVCVILSVG